MRSAPWLVLLLVATLALAGCSNPRPPAQVKETPLEFPKVDLAAGGEVKFVAAPEWRPGYHFAYETSGASEGDRWGAGYVGNSSGDETHSWGPRPGLNYTVVAVETQFGDKRFVALDREPGFEGPRMLAFDPAHLDPLYAYAATSCYSYHAPCTPSLHVSGDEDLVPALDFPLRDDQPSKTIADQAPLFPFGPIQVVTRVLGMKEVTGPTGPVQAVHIHQSFGVNMTRAAQVEAEDSGLDDLNLTGVVAGSRDVFYAPSLLNVVLDVSTSHGDYNGTYQRNGQQQWFGESWRRWSSTRLTAASYEETEAMTMGELYALQRSGQDPAAAFADIELQVSSSSANVATGESVRIDVLPDEGLEASSIRVAVYNAGGFPERSEVGKLSLDFAAPRPGPYLIVATVFEESGRVAARHYRSLYAYYEGETAVSCSPVAIDGVAGCPTVILPLGPAIAGVSAYALVGYTVTNSPLAQGRLYIDAGDGQNVSSLASGGYASLYLESPAVDPDHPDWTLGYQPDPGVAESVTYSVNIWPASVPTSVYEVAMDDGDARH